MLGSAVCSQTAAQNLTYAANFIEGHNFRAFEVYLVSTTIYLLLAICGQPAHDLQHFVDELWVQRRDKLLHGERAGNCNTLLLTAQELAQLPSAVR